ncbi:N-acetyltransferase family protein [Ramlibacter sp. MMS24-I3-19]|uniref:GNAT family N-acetyltransferase n=1 Tax=Ramlibacter sp. MMS24-I3-19 TaxID=3416606 RepID=UPI003D02368D
MLVRAALPDDADAIGRIRVNAWRAAYRDYMPATYLAGLDASANLDALRATLRAPTPPYRATVIELGAELVAFSIVGPPRYPSKPGTLELWALNVEPGHWHKGCGKRLMEEALRRPPQRCELRMELWCISGNHAARRLYESCGFVRTGADRSTSTLTGHPLDEVAYAKAL